MPRVLAKAQKGHKAHSVSAYLGSLSGTLWQVSACCMASIHAKLPCVVKRDKVPGEAARWSAQSATANPRDTGDGPTVIDDMLIRTLWPSAAAASIAELDCAVLPKKERI